MRNPELLASALIGAVASARSMTPMAAIATARLAGRRTPGRLLLLDYPLFKFGALAMSVGELFGDKMRSAPDRTVLLGMLAGGSERRNRRCGPGATRSRTGRSAPRRDDGCPAGLLDAGRTQAGDGSNRSDPQRLVRGRVGRGDGCGSRRVVGEVKVLMRSILWIERSTCRSSRVATTRRQFGACPEANVSRLLKDAF